MARPVTNLAASVRQRLLDLAKAKNQPFGVILVRYGLERLLYRLSVSNYRNRFILKGGLLVTLWIDDAMRVTKDIDFLGQGDDEPEHLKSIFAEILSIDAPDGLAFDIEGLTAEAIRETVEYGGTRLKTVATLEKARIPITIDIGFGDAVSPVPQNVVYPPLLDTEPSTIRAYPPAVVIAEKFQAMVNLGIINGRMKDYYDLWAIPQSLTITDQELDAAIEATFARRATAIPLEAPPGLSSAMYEAPAKLRQWQAYAQSINFESPSFDAIVKAIWEFVGPSCARLTKR